MAFQIDIMTLFPDMIDEVMGTSIIGRAASKGIISIMTHQIRDYTENKQKQVDDYPYGGGFGCVMMAQPLKSCLDAIKKDNEGKRSRVIYMSPQGPTFNQDKARQLISEYDHLILICGHYEGIDERFIEACVDEELSIGDFVLTGGEIAAMAVSDCVCRMIPGVLSDEECYTGESHWEKLLEYPQYTRPDIWEGRAVPEILRNGNHADILKWRRKQMLLRTMKKRPDVYSQFCPTEDDQKLLLEIKKDASRFKLTEEPSFKIAADGDLALIMQCVSEGRKLLRKFKVDQWQSEFPDESYIEEKIHSNNVVLINYRTELAGFFVVSDHDLASAEGITDGKWLFPEESYFLSVFAISKKFRSSGIAERMMKKIMDDAKKGGFHSIKCLIHKKNKSAAELLRGSGFEYRGNMVVFDEPYHDPRRQAFELGIKHNG